ncbi:isoprenyl transferase [Ornithinibacillus sp. BX22]|uniref:Isoprenyl transferase n=2 Tax=Ornithinibacillus TaxID=484508 RepID=A0A923L3U8_9BACI|nr:MULTISPECIES: isoprenyl transferase [Ornithinibacillus]MBC5635994.1 isoprenyl transferase [Ornithinibacillus hominis]MBS3680017.1 isoprenyl transferase [Ornithinibacillus massiliensis]
MPMKLPFFKSKNEERFIQSEELTNVPEHVAIIMDGNGRWAKRKGLPRIAGHKAGMDVVKKTVETAVKYNIKVLTLFAFSTENWRRPKQEVEYLLRLPKEFLHIYLPDLMKNNVRIETIGDFDSLPDYTKEAVRYAKEKTKNNDGLLLNFALNYGSRDEILSAIKLIMKDFDEDKFSLEQLDEERLSQYLYTNHLSDPDLLIRTSGEQRLSNFLLWQSAYTEFWFTDVLWPDFNEEIFVEALMDYQNRSRRFGGI